MEIRDLLCVDAESLSAEQARQVAQDVIAVLSAGGVVAEDQSKLKALLISAQEIATGLKVGESMDNRRASVLQKIKEAEERGDKRTARYLAESMAAADVAAADLADLDVEAAVSKYIADDIAATEALQQQKQKEMIDALTQEILYSHGWEITEEQARAQATREIVGPPAYEDDINEVLEKPDRRAILDTHKAAS